MMFSCVTFVLLRELDWRRRWGAKLEHIVAFDDVCIFFCVMSRDAAAAESTSIDSVERGVSRPERWN